MFRKFITNHKKLLIGFVFGSALLPFIAGLGLISPILGSAVVLLKPGIFVSQFFVKEVSEGVFQMSSFGSFLFFFVNGVFYAVVFYLLSLLKKGKKK
ncbi:hypothetical protein N9L18_00735 [Candidatus Pacebacteria bacterium]|nr:hypothetical protein [Candidatus Paceibacterota bacterium]